METSDQDIIFVGGGINALVAASLLARQGWRVTLLEREAQLGGCIRTEELTLPGFQHDTLSTAHPLFLVGPAYAALKDELHETGLVYCNNTTPTGVVMPDGRHLVLTTSREDNMRRFEACISGGGAAYQHAMHDVQDNADLIFTLLGNELWRWDTARKLAATTWRKGLQDMSAFAGAALTPAHAWLKQSFGSAPNPAQALLAPWVLHTGLGPDAPLSALMNKVVAFTLEAVGMPLVRGGNAQTVRAFETLLQRNGARWHTHTHVGKVLVDKGRAVGVRLANGDTLHAPHVACSVTPAQLYTQLLDAPHVPDGVLSEARNFRHGKGNMQIHLALSEAPEWQHEELARTVYVHLTEGVAAVSRAVNEAERGWLPAVPTVCVAQPTMLDPDRAPAGRHILWVQVPECPVQVLGDAGQGIELDGSGAWTASVREQFADRVMQIVAQHVPNLQRATLARKVLSPADLQKLNINLVGGDPYGGDCSLEQSLFWRPLRSTRNHSTPIANLWHIGASTHPGPGLGGGSGFHLAHALGAC
ncbi:NAD(P)/FAD-dependent oxidoreductase [Limnohabitans sp.]|uniref:phytoene desaturase family protein n=1 Tax=Limnohabitans sp. TaxID=1907725 RepID=UPI00286F821B|nr:NAD(P)/FAD-dependent oxidoreductase [Limnohabitans sp.]